MVPILQVKIYPIITQNVRVTSVHVPKYVDLELGRHFTSISQYIQNTENVKKLITKLTKYRI